MYYYFIFITGSKLEQEVKEFQDCPVFAHGPLEVGAPNIIPLVTPLQTGQGGGQGKCSLSLTFPLTHTLSHTHTLSYSLSHTHTLAHAHTLTRTHTRTHAQYYPTIHHNSKYMNRSR